MTAYRVEKSAFDIIMIPKEPKFPVLAKLVLSEKNKYYLSHIKDDINVLLKIYNRNKMPCVLIVKFHGDRPRKTSWSIIQIKREMPVYISRNYRVEFDYLE